MLKGGSDLGWMELALEEAQKAGQVGEVPVGAILVRDGQVIARGYNQSIGEHDPSAHAEIICLRAAGKKLSNYRFPGTTLYVTVEPCAMCAGALLWARVERVVYGCADAKAGALGSVIDLSHQEKFNHHLKVQGSIQEERSRLLLQNFFQQRR